MTREMKRSLRYVRRERAKLFAELLASEHNVTVEDILGRSRVVPLPSIRHELMTRLHLTGMTLKDVGRALNMDHTSVLHGVRKTMGEEAYAAQSPGPGRAR